MVCKKNIPEKGGSRKLSCARKRWATARLTIMSVRFFSCVIEVRAQSAQDLFRRPFVMMEPMIRRVVREEVGKEIAKHQSQIPRPSGYSSDFRYKLCFLTKLKNPIYTFSNIEGENDDPIQVSMLDAHSSTVKSGPFASAKVKIVVLHGDFCTDGRDTWTTEDFDNSKVSRRNPNKEALLLGNLEFRLEIGVASICNVRFSDISKWARSRKFRLGLKLIEDVGERVHEGISNPFKVKHLLRKGTRKMETPSLNDAVWRLNRIAKNGPCRKKLEQKGINTVNDLLKCYQEDEPKLREILANDFKKVIQHAKKAIKGDKFGQAPLAPFQHDGGSQMEAFPSDNMLCNDLPNGVSIGGFNEMVQPIASSSQINSQFVGTATEQPQNCYNMPSQNEMSNPNPPYVITLYHGSSSSRPDPFDCSMELPNQGQVAAHGGIPDIEWNNDTNIIQYVSVPVSIVNEQPQTIPSTVFGNYNFGVNNCVSPTDAHFTSLEDNNPATSEDLNDFDVDQFFQDPEPDLAEVDNCHYNEIYNALSMALAGVLLKRRWIKIVAAVKWRCLKKRSTTRHACVAPAL